MFSFFIFCLFQSNNLKNSDRSVTWVDFGCVVALPYFNLWYDMAWVDIAWAITHWPALIHFINWFVTLVIHSQHMQAIMRVSARCSQTNTFWRDWNFSQRTFSPSTFANSCNVEFSAEISSTEEDGVRDYWWYHYLNMVQNESAKSNISTSADSSDNVRGREESLRSVLNEEEENWKDMKVFGSYIKHTLLFYLRQCQCRAK